MGGLGGGGGGGGRLFFMGSDRVISILEGVIQMCLNGDARLISRMEAVGERREGLVI